MSTSYTLSISCLYVIPSMNSKICHENQIFSASSFLKELDINEETSHLETPKWNDKNEEGCRNVVKNIHVNIYTPSFANIFSEWDENSLLTNVNVSYENIPKSNTLFEHTTSISLTILPTKKIPLSKDGNFNKILPVKSKRNEDTEEENNSSQVEVENSGEGKEFTTKHISNCTFNYLQYFSPHLFNFSTITSSIYSFVKFSPSSCENFMKSLNSNGDRNCFVGECHESGRTWKSCKILTSPHVFVISVVPENFQLSCQTLIGLELKNMFIHELEKTYEYERLPSINIKLPHDFLYPFTCVKEED
uniref:Uncharacterized protein n=1 Tax=Strongyloides papillosus TaxID=174720 RepID=A0A0N5BQS8_STREA